MARNATVMSPEKVEEAAARFAAGASVTHVAAWADTTRAAVVSAMGYRMIRQLWNQGQITVIPQITAIRVPSAPKKSPPPAHKPKPAPEVPAYERSEHWPAGESSSWSEEQWDRGLREAYGLGDSANDVYLDTGMDRVKVVERWAAMGLPFPRI